MWNTFTASIIQSVGKRFGVLLYSIEWAIQIEWAFQMVIEINAWISSGFAHSMTSIWIPYHLHISGTKCTLHKVWTWNRNDKISCSVVARHTRNWVSHLFAHLAMIVRTNGLLKKWQSNLSGFKWNGTW